jgi:hypothetical protein
MKRLILIAWMGLVGAGVLTAQSPEDHNEGARVEWDAANSLWRIKWWGKAGRTYFIQHSPDLLRPWRWLPEVKAGSNSIAEGGFTASGGRAFLRLRYSDIPTSDPANADFDGDGLRNLEEVQANADPLDPDTDDDGIADGLEGTIIYRLAGGGWGYLSMTAADTDQDGTEDGQEDDDRDGLTVSEELALGTNPNLTDTDLDGVGDGKEMLLGTSPLDSDPWDGRDFDNDGLDDFTEITIGTSPFDDDSNNNGMRDREELDNGGNPAVPGPPPPLLPPPSGNPEPPPDLPPDPAPELAPAGYDILVETQSINLPKHGHPTFQVLDPPKRYLVMSASQTYLSSSGPVESGPAGITGSVTWTINPLTGETTQAGDEFAFSFGDPASPVRRSGTEYLYGYDDPPNEQADGIARINGVTTLANENTTAMLLANGKSQIPVFQGDFERGTPFAHRNLHENELQFDYQTVQFKFRWHNGVPEEQRRALSYLVVFQPEDDPETPEYEPVENAEVIDLITWNGQSAESEVFTIDPDQLQNGVDGSYFLRTVEIVPDAGMVGVVGDMVPSNRQGAGEKHFVTPKTTPQIPAPYATFTVSGITTTEFETYFEWGGGGESVAGEPNKRKVSRGTADKVPISLKLKQSNQEAAKLNVWVVWASANVVQVPTPDFYRTANVGLVDGTFGNRATFIAGLTEPEAFVFEFTIYPLGICDLASDIPDFTGPPSVLPPGGTHPLKPWAQLSGGADAKWDDSRAIQITITNPNIPRAKYPASSALVDNPEILAGQPADGVVVEFPYSDVVGTDDSQGTSLGGNPYEDSPSSIPDRLEHGIGKMRSDDRPTSSISDYLDEDATYEEANEFREFLRLNIGTRWYRVSDFNYWEFRLRTTKQSGNMLDDGSFSGTSL